MAYLTLPRIVVPAALVEEELRQLPVALVARVPVEAQQTDLQPLVTGDVRFLPARPVSGVHCVGRFDRRIEAVRITGRFVPGNRGLEKVSPTRGSCGRRWPSRLSTLATAPSMRALICLFQLRDRGAWTACTQPPRSCAGCRTGQTPGYLPENVLNRCRPVGFDLRRPERVGDVHLGLRHRDDRIVLRRSREAPHR